MPSNAYNIVPKMQFCRVCSVSHFEVNFYNTFIMNVKIQIGLVKVVEWPPFGKYLLPQFTIILFSCIFPKWVSRSVVVVG